MCGRFVASTSAADLKRYFSVDRVDDNSDQEANFNVTPLTEILAVRERKSERVLSRLEWGLVPKWAQDVGIRHRLINARLETLAEKPAFREAFTHRRCIIPVDGFYEWKVVGEPSSPKGRTPKTPTYIRRRDRAPLALAGLWEIYGQENGPNHWLRFCAIITTAAQGSLTDVHHRMPVMLPPSAWNQWLDPLSHDPQALTGLVERYPSAEEVGRDLEVYPVSTRVNSAQENNPGLIEPVSQ